MNSYLDVIASELLKIEQDCEVDLQEIKRRVRQLYDQVSHRKKIAQTIKSESLTCTCCGKTFTRKFSKYMSRRIGDQVYNRSVYVDETGRQINGRNCSNCKYLTVG